MEKTKKKRRGVGEEGTRGRGEVVRKRGREEEKRRRGEEKRRGVCPWSGCAS